MERCPTCNAKFGGKRICHRCRTDLGPLLDLEAAAAEHIEKALSAFSARCYSEMYDHARRSCALRETPAALRLLACAALLSGRFPLAASLWKRALQS